MRRARSAEANSAGELRQFAGSGVPRAMLSDKDLGCRISVLFRIEGDPEHPFSEVVGVLQRIDAGAESPTLQIVKRDGRLVAVDAEDVVTFKVLDRR